ncbi:MAG: sigma-54 dependent transcriptional regulator [Cyclobacteriaceae bacterium]
MIDNSEILRIKQRFGIVGNSELLNYAIQVAAQVAPTEMSVLITGESGAGKESFSKIIHHLSPRKHGQFIAINCGAIPEGTIDSELFGHEKGSFTGAHEARKGYFEVTNGGTIFLDEIGEMPVGTQARLLRVLENGEFIKVGSSKVLKTDVRVIAATNVDLSDAVASGKFRQDLYYRLNTVPIYVPALRERGADVELLFRKFASDFAERYKVRPISLTEEAKAVLLKYRFPGNIRQLKNLVEQISILDENREINADKLKDFLPKDSQLPALFSGNGSSNANPLSERDLLYKVLFDMRQDVTDLKKLVYKLMSGEQSTTEIVEDNPKIFKRLGTDFNEDFFNENEETQQESDEKQADTPIIINSDDDSNSYELERVEDIEHEEDENLSLEKKEKELIIKALRKNNNKRKYAAEDLGISERTLYRKIKQFNLEDL